MKLIVNTCYSHILWIMCAGELFSSAIEKLTFVKGPYHQYEGVAGYIETEVEMTIKDLEKFTHLWYTWYKLSDTRRLELYGLAKGLGACK